FSHFRIGQSDPYADRAIAAAVRSPQAIVGLGHLAVPASGGPGCGGRRSRQRNDERRALPVRALLGQRSTVAISHDVVAEAQPQARAGARCLGCKEGLEDALPDLWGNARTIVLNADLDSILQSARRYGDARG